VARAARLAAVTEESIPLPDEWPQHVRTGLLHALGLVRAAVFFVRGWAENSPLPRARLQGQNERLKTELLLAQQELRLKDARMSRLPPARRPHYAPVERLEILMLAAARGWSIAETARKFLVTSATIADWKKRCDEEGADALVQIREPVNKFPDFITALVQQCKTLVPHRRQAQDCRASRACWAALERFDHQAPARDAAARSSSDSDRNSAE
jgi:transposase-like protein